MGVLGLKKVSPSHLYQSHLKSINLLQKVAKNKFSTKQFNAPAPLDSSDGRVVRASASGAVDSGLISSQVKPITLKLAFTASLLDAQH